MKSNKVVITIIGIITLILIIIGIVVMVQPTKKDKVENNKQDQEAAIEIAKEQVNVSGRSEDQYTYKIEKSNSDGSYKIGLYENNVKQRMYYVINPKTKSVTFIKEAFSNADKEKLKEQESAVKKVEKGSTRKFKSEKWTTIFPWWSDYCMDIEYYSCDRVIYANVRLL